jgi:hypothetical protein
MESKDPALFASALNINEAKDFLVYSPAHVEEIAVSRMRNSYPAEEISKKLGFLAKITNSTEILPFERGDVIILGEIGGVYLCKEDPGECYKRVTANYGNNDYAEALQKSRLSNAIQRNHHGYDSNRQNNIPAESILSDPIHKLLISEDFFLRMLFEGKRPKAELRAIVESDFKGIRADFPAFECLMEVIFDYLEKIRYHPEAEKKYRSRLHDVTHAIYAAYCAVFVTGDKKLQYKAKAAYSFLGIPTEVILLRASDLIIES